MSFRYLTSSCFDTELSDAEFKRRIINGAFVLENYVVTYWISHLKKSKYAYDHVVPIQMATETLSTLRRNPSFLAPSPPDNVIANFRFTGSFDYEAATAFEFYKIRKRDLCFSDGKMACILVNPKLRRANCTPEKNNDFNCLIHSLSPLHNLDFAACSRV